MTQISRQNAVNRLLLAMLVILGFAGIELVSGSMFSLRTLTADGLDMLGHSGLLALALVIQTISAKMPEAARKRTEGLGGIAIATYLLIMAAFLLSTGEDHYHHHMSATHGGLIITGFGILSIIVHASTGRLLYSAKCHPLVLGACVYIFSHTFMAIAMLLGGITMTVTGMVSLDLYLSYGIAVFMALGAIKLGWLSYKQLS